MKELEIVLPKDSEKNIEKVIESICKAQELNVVSKNTLKKYPGCIHWHYQKPKESGTLEITYWPTKNRCWISLRDNRAKSWVVEIAQTLKIGIEKLVK